MKGKLIAAALAGLGSGIVCNYLQQNVSFFRNWWASPAAMLVGGYLLTRSKRQAFQSAGVALIGAGALKGYQNYKLTGPGSDDLPANPYTQQETGMLLDPTASTSAGAPSVFDAVDDFEDDDEPAETSALYVGRRAA